MTDATVSWLRPPESTALTDTAALNDIHALLTTRGDDPAGQLADMAAIVARSGRPMVRGRHIDAHITESPAGWPVARIDAEDTTVTVRQNPAGAGLQVEIATRTRAERDSLTVTLDGCRLDHRPPPGGHVA